MSFNISAFNESSILKKLTYTIDDAQLGIEDVISAEIHWSKDMFAVAGNILIKDNIDTTNLLPLNSNNVLHVYAEDGFDEFYFKSFVLMNVKELRYNQRHKALQMDFVDRLTFAMMNTFVGKSYSNKKLSEIFKEYYDKYKWSELLDPHVKLNLVETQKVHPFIVVPQDRNFIEWFKGELEKEGCTMYQTRKEIIVGTKKEDLLPTKLEKIPHSFSQLHVKAAHPFRIHDHKIDFNPVGEQSQKTPIGSSAAFDFATKTMQQAKAKLEDVFDSIKTSTSALGKIQHTVGEKLFTGTNRSQDMVKTGVQDAFVQNTKLSVVVVGNFKYNGFYKNADVVLSGNLEHKQGQNEGDVTMSGVYTILDVTDRMVSGRLFQRVRMARADFQENK